MDLEAETKAQQAQNRKNADDLAIMEGLGLDVSDAQDVATVASKTMPMVLDLARAQIIADYLSEVARLEGHAKEAEALAEVTQSIRMFVDGVRFGDLVVLKMAAPEWVKDQLPHGCQRSIN